MASVVLKDLNKRLLGLSCSSAASTSIVLSGRAIDHHSPPHLRDPARNYASSSSSSSKKKAVKKAKSKQQQLVSPASSSRFLLNSSRMQPSADDNIIIHHDMELPPPFIPVAAEENEIIAAAVHVGGGEKRESSSSSSTSVQPQVVVLWVSLHCKGCAGKVKKHISKMEGVTSLDIDIATKKVTVVGDVTPLAVLTTVSKIKPAQFWPIASSSSSPMPPRASASF